MMRVTPKDAPSTASGPTAEPIVADFKPLRFPGGFRTEPSPALDCYAAELSPEKRPAFDESMHSRVETRREFLARKIDQQGSAKGAHELKVRAYAALSEDAVEMGVTTPLPKLEDVNLVRAWKLSSATTRGESIPGSFTGLIEKSFFHAVVGQVSSSVREYRDVRDLWVATHELTHGIGGTELAYQQKKDAIVGTKTGLEQQRTIFGKFPLFSALEEVNATNVADRAISRLGGTVKTVLENVGVTDMAKVLPSDRQREFTSLFRRYDLGLDKKQSIDVEVHRLHDRSGAPMVSPYEPTVTAMRMIAHEALKLDSPEHSWRQFSAMLSRAHAGDPGAQRTLLATLKDAFGSDGLRLLGEVQIGFDRETVATGNAYLMAFALARRLDPHERQQFRSELLHVLRGEAPVRAALSRGDSPGRREVAAVRAYHDCIPRSLKETGAAAVRQLLRDGYEIRAARIMRALDIAPGAFGEELAAKSASIPSWKRWCAAGIERVRGMLR